MPTIAPVRPPGAPQFSPGRLKALRSIRKLSQRQLAAAIGRDPSLIALYEGGVREPSAKTLGALAHVLDCTIDAMYEVPEPETTG